MSSFYDEIEIEDMEYDEDSLTYFYPCPCGDRFEITLDELRDGDDVAKCPSCSLLIKIIYDPDGLPDNDDDDEGEIMLLGTSIVAKTDSPAVTVQPIVKASGNDDDKGVTPLGTSNVAESATPAVTVQPNNKTPVVGDDDKNKDILMVSKLAITEDGNNTPSLSSTVRVLLPLR